jgi:Ca2+-binding RTX toxin-like protein
VRIARRPLALSFVVAAVLALAPATGSAGARSAPRCLGRVATIVGTSGDDRLVGTSAPDVIVGLGGWDFIESGGGGDDRICGGVGSDFMEGGPGDDRLLGEGGGDAAHGGPGRDLIVTGAGSVEALFGGRGQDRLFGGRGSFDGLIGGGGDDLLNGGAGQDLAEFFESPGPVEGDLETDLVTGHGEDRLVGIEGLVGSSFDDVLLGDDASNLLVGEEGDDLIMARGSGPLEGLGADVLDGIDGDDTLDGGEGADIVRFEDSPTPVTVDLAAGTATGWGSDVLSSIEAVIGSDLDDTLIGDANDNAFVGGFGDDAIDGRGGVDQAAYFDSFEPVVVDLAAGTATGWGSDLLVDVEDVFGSGHDDLLAGDDGPNAIVGAPGADTIAGAGGDDELVGRRGADSADGGPGTDACDAETEVACEVEPAARRAADRDAPRSPRSRIDGWSGWIVRLGG